MKISLFSRIALSSAAIAVAAVGFAQDRQIPASGVIQVSKPEVINPKSFVPQIDTFVRQRAHASKNETGRPPKISPTPNQLPVGNVDKSLIRSDAKIVFPGIGFTGYVPPDCDMGVSQNWVVVTVNTDIAFYRKSNGQKTFQQDMTKFLNGNAAHVISDPKVFFDTLTNRWFTLIIDADFTGKTSTMLMAISDSEDPNGTWKKFTVDSELKVGTDEFWLDYPGFGVNKDTIVFTGNMFGYTAGYAGNEYIVFPKTPAMNGQAFTAKQFNDQNAGTTKVAISADPASDKLYCVSFDSTTQLKVSAIEGGASSNATLTTTMVNIPTATPPIQGLNGPGGQVDGFGDSRLFTANYRNGSLVTAHSLAVSGTDGRQMVRWYQVAMNNWPSSALKPSLTNAGNVAGGSGENYHMPGINMNARGDIAVVFSRTSGSQNGDMLVAAHKKTDAYGVMSKPVVVQAATGQYVGYRWGDYAAVSVDPSDNRTFYAFHMTGRADGYWTTFVGSFKVSSAGDNAVAYPALTAAPLAGQGTLGAGTVANLATVDGKSVNVNSVALKNIGQVSSLECTYQTGLTNKTTDFTALQMTLAAPTGTTAFVYLWNYLTGSYDLTGSQPATNGEFKFSFADLNAPKYMSADGKMKALVRTVRPVKGAMPPAYILKVDQMQVLAGLKS